MEYGVSLRSKEHKRPEMTAFACPTRVPIQIRSTDKVTSNIEPRTGEYSSCIKNSLLSIIHKYNTLWLNKHKNFHGKPQGKENLNNAKHPAFRGPLLNLKLDLQMGYVVRIRTVSEETAGNFSTKFLASSTGRPIERRPAAPTVTIKVVLRSVVCLGWNHLPGLEKWAGGSDDRMHKNTCISLSNP